MSKGQLLLDLILEVAVVRGTGEKACYRSFFPTLHKIVRGVARIVTKL